MMGTNGIEVAYGFIRRSETELKLGQIPLDVFGMISKFYCNEYQYEHGFQSHTTKTKQSGWILEIRPCIVPISYFVFDV